MRAKRYITIAAGAAFAVCLATQVQASGSGGSMMNDNMLQELKRMIEQQQKQIDQQAAEIAELKEQLTGNTEMLADKADKEDVKGLDKVVTSSFERVNLSLYGHVNRALLYANNGDTSKWYSVDNINSQTRLGLRASVETMSGWNVGGRIEYGIVSNASSDVNQFNTANATSSNFKLRWAEVSFQNDTFGKISLGKGSSVTDGSAEVDLSGTTVATYASVVDIAGSIPWYDGVTPLAEGGLEIGDVYANFDGGRTDRIRYDTPSFAGFSLATSANSGDAFDGGLRYSRDFQGTKVAAAFAATNPGDLIAGAEAVYLGSASILLPMGLNATFSSALQEWEDSDRDNATNWYGKLGYKTMFYEGSSTALSVDYGETSNLAADNDKAKTWAVAAVHNVNDWATEFYAVWRNYKLDSDAADYDDINVFMTGARLKF